MSKEENKKTMKRREFMLVGSSFALIGAALAGAGAALYKYLYPVVSYGKPRKFRLKKEQLPEIGDELIFSEQKIVVRRKSEDEIAAISLVCTHLGCTVYWQKENQEFYCPCHAGRFDKDGNVVAGPPPTPLETYHTEIEEDNVFIYFKDPES